MQASRNPGGRPRTNPVFSRPANAPAVHDHSIHIDHAGVVSSQAVPNVDHCKGRRPTDLEDEYAQAEFEPLLPPELIYAQDDREHDDMNSEQEEEEDAGGNNDTTEGGTAKRKCYASSGTRHETRGAHSVTVWRDATWQTISLREMGLVYQLGHQGARCRVPDATPHIMTVMHINGVHPLLRSGLYPATTRYPATCATIEVLNLYRRLKTIATVNVRDFVTALEDQPDPYGTSWTLDCYKAFDWETVLAEYQRIVSQDANFRMRCKMRSSPYVDLPLYNGLGVQMPTELYHKWLRKYITEEEISSCVAFAALMQKDMRFSVGLRWAGVIGVICTRHEIMLGLGDLEKGERYKNTDFVLYWVLSKMGLKEVTVTTSRRGSRRPDVLKNLDLPEIQWGLPIWHGGPHEISCETAESLKYKEGVGKTDGEGIERVWSVLNPMSYMMREEQPGAHHDDIEDKVDKHNFGKNIHLERTLLRRLRIALQEKEVQVKGFDVVDEALDDEIRSDWMGMVVDWLKDPAKPNPYAPSEKESKAKSDLRQQELKEEAEDEEEFDASGESDAEAPRVAARGQRSKKKTKPKRNKAGSTGMRVTMSAFLIMGLQLEDALKENLMTEQQSKVYKRRRPQMAKLKVFRKWQNVYMPQVTKIIEKEEVDRRSRSAEVPPVEDARLYLPSECAKSQELDRKVRCPWKLLDKEEALRRGQCSDALGRIRARLLAKRYLMYFRNEHVRGQREGGRAATTLSTMATKLKESVVKYRHCRDRLVALVGEAGCDPSQVLEDEDVKVYQTAESDEDAMRKLSHLEAWNSRVTGDSVSARLKKTKRRDVAGETRAVMSWIWTAGGGPDANEDGYLHECVRIEWVKALARKTRWTEEVEILKEEMRRVLRSLRFEEQRWMYRAEKDYDGLCLEEIAGRKAYTRRQARDRRCVRESFETLWGMTRPARGQKAGPKDGEAQRAAAAIISEEQAAAA
ncbi:hypothetical protein BDZ89DRAFT_1049367 [Hymenopellis radicata]|nr:hypothetical protein BDZ89DRAFT_1049367 [Hymenopellis radicata]